jgi:hypothetical protein
MRTDYRVMWWTGGSLPWVEGGGPWTEEARRRYTDGGYDGLFYQFERPVTQSDLGFLTELPSVRYLEVVGDVRDDTAAFTLPELEELILATRCRRAIPSPVPAQPQLKRLLVNTRPNMEAIHDMPRLHDLTVYLWTGQDLRFLGPKPVLERLEVEGMLRFFSPTGVDGCTAITDLRVTEARVQTLAPLGTLTTLRRLRLIGSSKVPGDNSLDLSDLQALTNLEELRITYGGRIRSLWPVLSFPRLRDLRLRGTAVMDGDLAPLDRLPPTVTVVRPEG